MERCEVWLIAVPCVAIFHVFGPPTWREPVPRMRDGIALVAMHSCSELNS